MIYTTIFEIIYTLILFLVKVIILYLLIKIFNKSTNFVTVLKAVFIFEIIAYFIFAFYSSPSIIGRLMYTFHKILILNLVIMLLFFLALFLTFSFLLKKFTSLNWKKSLLIFIIICLIIPMFDYALEILTRPIFNISVFRKEIQEYALMLKQKGLFRSLLEYKKDIIWSIHNSLVGLPQYFSRFTSFRSIK